ncbi:MAG: hypothetical protein ACRC92_03425 [Peptostreptococcaceae bacterium]
MNNNKNYDYYIEKLMNHIYEQKLYRLAYDLEVSSSNNTDSRELDSLINAIIDNNIILDFDVEGTVKEYIQTSSEDYFFRRSIAIEKNHLYPILFDNQGNPKVDYNYSSHLITLWKNDMDDFYVEEVYSRFSKETFTMFVKNNINNLMNNIVTYVENRKSSNKIVIKCNSKDELLNTMKEMIINNELSTDWAEFLVDMDKLRNEMIAYAGDFDLYSEFDKLEEDTKYCLDNYCKYNSNELFDILTREKCFTWDDNLGLVSQ